MGRPGKSSGDETHTDRSCAVSRGGGHAPWEQCPALLATAIVSAVVRWVLH